MVVNFYKYSKPCELYADFIDLIDSFDDRPFTMKRLADKAPEYLVPHLEGITDLAGLLKELIEIQLDLGVVEGKVSGILRTG